MEVHAFVLKSPEMNVVKMWALDELRQFDVDVIEPVDPAPLPLDIRNPLRLEPVYHVRQSTQVIFPAFLLNIFG